MKRSHLNIGATIAAAFCACAVALMLVAPDAPSPDVSPSVQAQTAASDASPEATGQVGMEQAGPAGEDGTETGDAAVAYEPGSVLVTLYEGMTGDQAVAALSAIPELAGVALEGQVTDQIVKVRLPQGLAVEHAVELAEQAGVVQASQPNYRYYLQDGAESSAATALLSQSAVTASGGLVAGSPLGEALNAQGNPVNDPRYDEQWALPEIHAPEAWEELAQGASDRPVTVAVIDQGFLMRHEDLIDNIAGSYDAASEEGPLDPSDTSGSQNHGTHVAGIIGARTDNGKGVAGTTRNYCQLLPIKIADAEGRIYTEYLLNAYDYLIKQAKAGGSVRVANVSIGIALAESVDAREFDSSFYDLVEKAKKAGIVTVVAACNANYYTINGVKQYVNPPFNAYPADYDNVVTVINLAQSASAADGVVRSSTSNYNVAGQTTKNISAPGQSILSSYAIARALDSYSTDSGTSMAAPMVSGVLALMFKANPSLTADEAVSTLYATARDIGDPGWDEQTGYGEVDAAAAVTSVLHYTVKGASQVVWGSPSKMSVLLDGQAQEGWAWSSDNESAVTITPAGKATAVGAGSAMLTATKNQVTVKKSVTAVMPAITGGSIVYEGADLALLVQLDGADQTGWAWSSDNESVATVSSSGTVAGVSEGRAVIRAEKDGLVLTKDVQVIGVPTIDIASCTITLDSVIYSGEKQVPHPVVKYQGSVLTEDVDYKVVYDTPVKAAGTYPVTVCGEGLLVGEATVDFVVAKAANDLSVEVAPKQVVKQADIAKKNRTYQLITVNAHKGTVSYKKASSSKLGLKPNGKVIVWQGTAKGLYKMKVEVSAAGKPNYLPASTAVKVKVRVK